MPSYIWHVTLDTGDSYRSPRSAVSDEALKAAGAILDRALTPPALPERSAAMLPEPYVQAMDMALGALHPAWIGGPLRDWTLTATAEGRCAVICTAWRHTLVRGGVERLPIATFGVARESRCGASLWKVLHGEATHYPTDPSTPPGAPWMAARREATAAYDWGPSKRNEMMALADFERCIAWAWVEQ